MDKKRKKEKVAKEEDFISLLEWPIFLLKVSPEKTTEISDIVTHIYTNTL